MLRDEAFMPPPAVPEAAAVMSLSPAMRRYIGTELLTLATHEDPRRALIDALYRDHGLRLEYDATTTRSASETFDARAGNCLSLVLMTASIAREIGLPVTFQAVMIDELHSRDGNIHLTSGHVNVVLGRPRFRGTFGRSEPDGLVVDFLPRTEFGRHRVRKLDERTIVAMYYNNRAAELLVAGDVRSAYWYARRALLHAPTFSAAANTLGVVFERRGDAVAAEVAYEHALDLLPDSVGALSNLIRLLRAQQRTVEASTLQARLEALEPEPPFHNLSLGRTAMAAKDYVSAAAYFERELRLYPRQEDVHHLAAQAYAALGDAQKVRRHIRMALQYSLTPQRQRRFAAKLEKLRSPRR